VTTVLEGLGQPGADFLAERHLATLSTLGPGGLIHVAAVGFTLAEGIVRVITSDGSQKVRNVERDPRATVAQVDGRRWLSLAGTAVVERDPDAVARAEELYAVRYRPPRVNPRRVVIRLTPQRLLGSRPLLAPD
jgi:F420H(2)-dependent biliverdin reductase